MTSVILYLHSIKSHSPTENMLGRAASPKRGAHGNTQDLVEDHQLQQPQVAGLMPAFLESRGQCTSCTATATLQLSKEKI